MLSIIIVNYNSLPSLKLCLASISEKITDSEYEVIVVNNDQDSIELPAGKFPLKTVEVNDNIGFGAACNIGAKESAGEYLCFLNPDTLLLSASVKELLEKFKSDPSLGLIGPKLITKDGLPEPWSFGKEPTIWNIARNNLFPEKDPPPDVERQVEWISGAAMFVRKELFEKLDGFDEGFFMYFEDVDLCRRARKNSFGILRYPRFRIRHLGGGSFQGYKLQKKYYYRSQDLYFLKHFGRTNLFLLKFLRMFH